MTTDTMAALTGTIDNNACIIKEIKENNETVKLEILKRFCGYLMWRTHSDIQSGKVGRQ